MGMPPDLLAKYASLHWYTDGSLWLQCKIAAVGEDGKMVVRLARGIEITLVDTMDGVLWVSDGKYPAIFDTVFVHVAVADARSPEWAALTEKEKRDRNSVQRVGIQEVQRRIAVSKARAAILDNVRFSEDTIRDEFSRLGIGRLADWQIQGALETIPGLARRLKTEFSDIVSDACRLAPEPDPELEPEANAGPRP